MAPAPSPKSTPAADAVPAIVLALVAVGVKPWWPVQVLFLLIATALTTRWALAHRNDRRAR